MHTQVKHLVPGFERDAQIELRKKQEAEAKQMFLRGKKEVDFRQKLLDEATEAHDKAKKEYEKVLSIDIDDIEIPVNGCSKDDFMFTRLMPSLSTFGTLTS